MRRRRISRERLAMIRLYAGRTGMDVTLLWIALATERVRAMPTRTMAQSEAKAYAFMEAMRQVPRPRVPFATPERV